jgi:hypothetical protein
MTRWISYSAVAVSAVLLLICLSDLLTPYDDAAFDSRQWQAFDKSVKDRDGASRTSMVSNLEDRVLEKGMSRDKVIGLLGPPEATYDVSEAGPDYSQYSSGRLDVYDLEANATAFTVLYDVEGRLWSSEVKGSD